MSPVTPATLPVTAAPCTSVSSVVMSSRSTTAAMSTVFSHPQQVGGLIKHIPKSARPACATHLTGWLHKVRVNGNDLEAWSSLLHYGAHILHKPARTGARHNLASIIKKRMDGSGSEVQPRPANSAHHRRRDANELLAAAVTAKVEDGNLKAAIRILCSEEKPATDIDATYIKLLERHPAPPNN